MSKILITGGAGFIGTHLCKRLHENNHEVTIIDNFNTQVHKDPDTHRALLKQYCKVITGDIVKGETWYELYGEEFDAIIHLAAETGTGQSMSVSKRYCDTNVLGTAELNDIITDESIIFKKIILLSSRAVYGDAYVDCRDIPMPTKETYNTNPVSIYGLTKLMQEQILQIGNKNIPLYILRLQNVYGPGQSLNNPYTGIMSIFSNAIRNNKDLQIFSDGKMTRDFIYVSDVVDSVMLMLDDKESKQGIYNVGTGIPTTVFEIASKLKEAYKSSVNIKITGEEIAGDIRHNFANISKIQQLGFSPKVSIDEGMKRLIEWTSGEAIIESDYEKTLEDFRNKKLLNA